MSERVSFTTSDGVEIVGDFYPSHGKAFAILLHMMPATRESWKPFAAHLVEAGYSVLAIDERGHGESTMDGKLDYKTLSDEQQQAKIRDVEAAFIFLKGKDAQEANAVVIGASIGANLAIQFLAEHPEMKAAVALSPGLDYHGIVTEPLVSRLASGQRVLLVASDDDEESFASIRQLKKRNPAQAEVFERTGIGHGTAMFDKDPGLMNELVAWLER